MSTPSYGAFGNPCSLSVLSNAGISPGCYTPAVSTAHCGYVILEVVLGSDSGRFL